MSHLVESSGHRPSGGIVETDKTARSAALRRLDAFIGEWAMEASGMGRTIFEWALDGQFLLQRSEAPNPRAPDSVAIVGVDPDGEAYAQHYFDSRGVVRVYAMTFSDGVWKLLRDKPDFSPLAFSQRFTGTFSDDGNTIAGLWEIRRGSSWERDFDLSYTRVG
jgi:hypothetical protein